MSRLVDRRSVLLAGAGALAGMGVARHAVAAAARPTVTSLAPRLSLISGAGNVRLSCNTHPWMRGWLVAAAEAAAVSGADGRFTIDNIPPGTYDVRVWHETLKGAPQKVTVSAGKPSEINFQLK